MFKTQLQVIDNTCYQSELRVKTEADYQLEVKDIKDQEIEEEDLTPVTAVVMQHKTQIDFVEPQSMNFELKINFTFPEFRSKGNR